MMKNNHTGEKRGKGSIDVQYDEEKAKQVLAMSQYGVSMVDISVMMDLDETEIKLLYAKEIKRGAAIANATVGKMLFEQARNGDAKAAAQWMRWKEMQK